MSQIKRHLEHLLDPTDAASQELLGSIDSALALEAMSVYLQGAASQLGPVGLRLANIAIEAHSNIPALRGAPLAFSLEDAGDPEAMVANGVKAIQAQIDAAWGAIDEGLSKLMQAQVAKMNKYKDRAAALQEAVICLAVDSNALDNGAVAKASTLTPTLDLFRLAKSTGFTSCAADVAPAVKGLLLEHGSAWHKLVEHRVQWLKDHATELLANQNVFGDLAFDGQELVMLNAKQAHVDGEVATYKSDELPGGFMLSIQLPAAPVLGLPAIDAMRKVDTCVVPTADPKNECTFNVLSPAELRVLVGQLKELVPALGDWYGAIYTNTWSNDAYSELLCRAVFRGAQQESNMGEREFKHYAITVFHLMNVATRSIDDYTFDTLEALVSYAQASLAQYK